MGGQCSGTDPQQCFPTDSPCSVQQHHHTRCKREHSRRAARPSQSGIGCACISHAQHYIVSFGLRTRDSQPFLKLRLNQQNTMHSRIQAFGPRNYAEHPGTFEAIPFQDFGVPECRHLCLLVASEAHPHRCINHKSSYRLLPQSRLVFTNWRILGTWPDSSTAAGNTHNTSTSCTPSSPTRPHEGSGVQGRVSIEIISQAFKFHRQGEKEVPRRRLPWTATRRGQDKLVSSAEYKRSKGHDQRRLQNTRREEARKDFNNRKRLPGGIFHSVRDAMSEKTGEKPDLKWVQTQYRSAKENTQEWRRVVKAQLERVWREVLDATKQERAESMSTKTNEARGG
ncbi:hypothetical protein B0O80DRAFT_220738 [Mortierella sp. GBAus27b]|nr:hypothetical protein B0O80DRAFT_220738 [Mortierella sp. GBAus27b]